jgi:hypothetical protein
MVKLVVLASSGLGELAVAIGKVLLRVAGRGLERSAEHAPYVGLGLLACLHVVTIAAAMYFARRGRTKPTQWAWILLTVWVVAIDIPVLIAWLR